ncbi:MAG: C40 family peptidase [Thermodesulfobacteriota bacterium]
MTTGAKWVLAVLMLLSAGLVALGAGLSGRSSAAPERRAHDPDAVSLYLAALRGGLPAWAAAEPAAASRLLSHAFSQMGRTYVRGGTGGAGFDCSGFTSWAYAKAGLDLPRTSGEQFKAGRAVAASALRPGDLVFFEDGGKVGHVGIYTSGGRFIHSSRASGGVAVDDLSGSYWSRAYAGARRVTAGRELPR